MFVHAVMPWTQFLFSPSGRITRRDFWLRFVLPLLLLSIALLALLPPPAPIPLGQAQADPFVVVPPWAYALVVAVNGVAIMVSVKRCHDRNHSGWFLLICFIPAIGPLWLLVDLGFLRGTAGANRFGPDPVTGSQD